MQQQYVTLGQPIGNRQIKRFVNIREPISALDEKSDYFMLENIELDGLTREIVDELKPEADKKNVKFSIDGENAVINGARQIIYEMVYNLCDNAIKYNKDNGRVNIHIENLKDCVTFEISDTGIFLYRSCYNPHP